MIVDEAGVGRVVDWQWRRQVASSWIPSRATLARLARLVAMPIVVVSHIASMFAVLVAWSAVGHGAAAVMSWGTTSLASATVAMGTVLGTLDHRRWSAVRIGAAIAVLAAAAGEVGIGGMRHADPTVSNLGYLPILAWTANHVGFMALMIVVGGRDGPSTQSVG